MHKTRYNALRLVVQLSPVGPLLIKAGGFSANPSLPDMQFVRTYQNGEEALYIPGASVKGVVRGFVEQALRTLNDRTSWRWACATFESKDKEQNANLQSLNCPQHLERLKQQKDEKRRTLESWEIYRNSCGACRLFGHTRLRGRLAFTDLLPKGNVKTETRYGVAISRLSHAVAQGPFEMEVAVSGVFEGQVVLENYELWQVGVLATALEAMNQGLLKVGFGKNRGFGQVQVTAKAAYIEELLPLKAENPLRGLADFVSEDERARYGLAASQTFTDLPQLTQSENLGFYSQRTFDTTGWQAISRQVIQALG